jgi:Na+-transporting NADH:ubiquinone oxidoreductase subunit C
MKNFSNTYIFIFSAVMVILVAALLSVVAQMLQPRQNMNIRVETMQNILTSVQVKSTVKTAENLFEQYITDSYVIDPEGKKLEGVIAFDVDLKKEVTRIDQVKKYESLIRERRMSPFKNFLAGFIKSRQVDRGDIVKRIGDVKQNRQLPVYICEKEGEKYYVFPLRGKGLWGPIWGYMALESDLNTVYGSVFDHKSETPGLGAEINEDWFQADFVGKKIFQDGKFTSVEVAKGGAPEGDMHAVDAISGGTITSKGVEAMIYDCLSGYQAFIEQQRN